MKGVSDLTHALKLFFFFYDVEHHQGMALGSKPQIQPHPPKPCIT